MVIKIHLYYKKSQLRKIEITDGGHITIKLDPSYVIYRNGRPVAVFNPISNMILPLHPDLVVYHHQ